MDCKIEIIPRLLHFKQPAGTSRGVYTTRKVWYLHLTSPDYPGRTGIGECAPLPALSCDDLPDYENILAGACRRLEQCGGELDADALRDYPSILFGLETALRHFLTDSDKRAYLDGQLRHDALPDRGENGSRFPLHQTENRRYRL